MKLSNLSIVHRSSTRATPRPIRWSIGLFVAASIAAFLVVAAAPASACSITSSRVCGGKACPKGETCQKASDGLSCSCVKSLTVSSGRDADSCQRANAALSALLGSSNEEIQLQAAMGLLEHGCGSGSTGAGISGMEAQPGCREPASSQYESCKASCRKNSPGLPECFDGCVEVLGAVLTRCAQGANFVAGNRGAGASSAACYDCQRDCAEDYYQCNKDCQQADPWDPDCYDSCEDDCDSACTPPC